MRTVAHLATPIELFWNEWMLDTWQRVVNCSVDLYGVKKREKIRNKSRANSRRYVAIYLCLNPCLVTDTDPLFDGS